MIDKPLKLNVGIRFVPAEQDQQRRKYIFEAVFHFKHMF